MAGHASSENQSASSIRGTVPTQSQFLNAVVNTTVKFFASVQLTVVLLAMGIFIVLAGTMAQVDQGIWQVTEQYFRTSIAWVDLQIFFPRHWFPNMPDVPGRLPFPGGWLIGLALAVNLIVAYLIRYRANVSKARRVGGVVVLSLGMILTWLVVVSGVGDRGATMGLAMNYQALWLLIKGSLGLLWLAAVYGLVSLDRARRIERLSLLCVVLGLGGLLAYLFHFGQEAAINDSSMRIVWQLTKGTVASLVLLSGCAMLYQERAGLVLMHFGVGLLMLGELVVGLSAVEGRMRIAEGESVNFVEEGREWELAVVDSSAPDHDRVVVVPASRLNEGETIRHEDVPFDLKVATFFGNSALRVVKSGDPNRATAGTGLTLAAEHKTPASGTESGVDVPSVYLTFTEKDSGKSLGTYLLSGYQSQEGIVEQVGLGGKRYDVSLRNKRIYKPYTIQLIDFRFDKYLGTSKAKNFSSDIRLVDPTRGVDRDIKIWMNNPLRYAGETFYQSGYETDPRSGVEVTVLQVVSNWGWMIPYVSCMLVAIGMLTHFVVVLLRFLKNRPGQEGAAAPLSKGKPSPMDLRDVAFPLLVVVGCAALVGSAAIPPRAADDELRLYDFGKLPLAYEGRVKPFDALARNSLRILSKKQTFEDDTGARQPAIRWLLDVISRTEQGRDHRVFRIEHMEVLDLLGLPRRKGLRYAINEFVDNMDEFSRQVKLARAREKHELTVFQRKILELDLRISHFRVLEEAFHPATIRAGHEKDDVFAAMQRAQALSKYQPPLAVPGDDSSEQSWESFTGAWAVARGRKLLDYPPNSATVSLSSIFDAYRDADVNRFNRELLNYQRSLRENPPEMYDVRRTRFEAFFNHWQPYTTAAALYVVAFLLASLACLGWSGPLNRAAIWLVVFTFVFHTFALIGRMYISGRPPVTNLYSSAVFIGWGCVLLGMLFEMVYRIGIGIIVSAVSGFSTLLVAHFLARSGDTFVVLRAVLDTQFWLATHVTSITLGYSATFVAGGLGILYILRGVFTPSLTPRLSRDLSRMIYGTICFALFFSFVGTVLGGLWADDSWGRFWGWDPKENGALVIVLWSALVLHARWCGMVQDRGVAVLAVGGNICTAWSWFGTNELGVGLHSYGFTEGVLPVLGLFCATQLAIIAIGMMPYRWWWSFRRASAE